MRKELLPPLALLTALLAFTLWNSTAMARHTTRWQEQLRQADTQSQQKNWSAATEMLTASYRDWTARQAYLHIVSRHDVVDQAEAMYRRALAFAATQEPSEFRAEMANLRSQLRLLAEMERFHFKNIL